jgi:hypothetical protein
MGLVASSWKPKVSGYDKALCLFIRGLTSFILTGEWDNDSFKAERPTSFWYCSPRGEAGNYAPSRGLFFFVANGPVGLVGVKDIIRLFFL